MHADCDYIGPGGGVVTRSNLKSRPAPGADYGAYRWLFMGEHYVFNPTIALRRESFLAIGGFDETIALEDLDCWLRLSVQHPIARVPEVLASYRKHSGNSLRQRTKMLGALFNTYGKFLAEHQGMIDEDDLRKHFRQNVWRFFGRIRRKHPRLIISAIAENLGAHFHTPESQDYLRVGRMLDRLPT